MLVLLTAPPVPRRISGEVNCLGIRRPLSRDSTATPGSASNQLESLNINSSLEIVER